MSKTMSISKQMDFENQTFEAGLLAKTLVDIFSEFGDQTPPSFFQLSEKLPDGATSTRHLTWTDLETICDLSTRSVQVMFKDKSGGMIYIVMDGYGSRLDVHISCENAMQLREIYSRLVSSLGLKEAPPEPPGGPVSSDIERRLNTLEKAVFGRQRPLRCFLSYRFLPESEIIALKVQQFLNLLDVEVVSGASYEPKRISEKVLSKLTGSLDFIVLLVSRAGESMWTRDEIATALSQGIAVVPVVESGASFAAGLFGDLEHIPFEPGHIGDTFLKLLEAVRFLQRERLGSQDKPEASETEQSANAGAGPWLRAPTGTMAKSET
jgi:hypothetical protein